MIEIRSLQGIDFDTLTNAFNDAFSDYDIPAHYTTEYLTNLVLRRGYRPDLAVGAFDQGRLVGFVFNCLDGDAAYNSGTGVVRSHRRRGIGRQLMQRSIDALPARRYILECIETNTRAASLYRQLGFVVTRMLQSWRYESRRAGDWKRAALPPDDWFDMAPSWQNSPASLRRAREPYDVLGDERGSVAVFPSNGDVPLLAVRRDVRRRGIGRELLEAAAAHAGKPLRIMNIDDANAGITAFLEACGATRTVRQFEMIRYSPTAAR